MLLPNSAYHQVLDPLTQYIYHEEVEQNIARHEIQSHAIKKEDIHWKLYTHAVVVVQVCDIHYVIFMHSHWET